MTQPTCREAAPIRGLPMVMSATAQASVAWAVARRVRFTAMALAASCLLPWYSSAASGNATVLHAFSGTDGEEPSGGVTPGPDGAYYGVTRRGGPGSGPNGGGVLYRLTPDGAYRILHSFGPAISRGEVTPTARPVVGSDGMLYGTTMQGGAGTKQMGKGVIYRVALDGSAYQVLHKFALSDFGGRSPNTPLVEAPDGNFYGTVAYGGRCAIIGGCGLIYRISKAGQFNVVRRFSARRLGLFPSGALILMPDGAMYGTTQGGGNSPECNAGCGVLYRLMPNGSYAVLHEFHALIDGALPVANLVADPQGWVIGATFGSGPGGGMGTIYRADASGNVAVCKFDGVGFPDTAPSLAPSGDLWISLQGQEIDAIGPGCLQSAVETTFSAAGQLLPVTGGMVGVTNNHPNAPLGAVFYLSY